MLRGEQNGKIAKTDWSFGLFGPLRFGLIKLVTGDGTEGLVVIKTFKGIS